MRTTEGKPDWYVRIALTVIALCLMWDLAVKAGPIDVQVVGARSGTWSIPVEVERKLFDSPTEVKIVGIDFERGQDREPLPVQIIQAPLERVRVQVDR